MERNETPNAADEKTMLVSWLDWQRATVHLKCEGLAEDLAHRAQLPGSPLMTVAGLVSHLRWVERAWFQHVLAGAPDDAPWTKDDPDKDFRVDDVPLTRLLADYADECARSDALTAALSLDAEAKGTHRRGRVTLRWVLVHLIEETARHNGHLDILREMLDGVTGD